MMGWKWKYGKQIANLIKSLRQGSVLNCDCDIKYILCMNVLLFLLDGLTAFKAASRIDNIKLSEKQLSIILLCNTTTGCLDNWVPIKWIFSNLEQFTLY